MMKNPNFASKSRNQPQVPFDTSLLYHKMWDRERGFENFLCVGVQKSALIFGSSYKSIYDALTRLANCSRI